MPDYTDQSLHALDLAFARDAEQIRRFVAQEPPLSDEDELIEAQLIAAIETAGICPHCGEPAGDIEEVEERDDETGYHNVLEMCGDCRREPKRREAEECGGLRPDALFLLGVDESWLYEGNSVPSKPVRRETGLPLRLEEEAS